MTLSCARMERFEQLAEAFYNVARVNHYMVKKSRYFVLRGDRSECGVGQPTPGHRIDLARGHLPRAAHQSYDAAWPDMATRELADCATQGEPEKGAYGNMVRRWKWHAPIAGRAAPVRAPVCSVDVWSLFQLS
jgi:hypothetical protein